MSLPRIVLILVATLGLHMAVVAIRALSRNLLRSRIGSQAKMQTFTGFMTNVVVVALYFLALGFALQELGVSLTAYFASASVIGLAVSFGSQGVVQDVITALTVVFSDLIDVGDMVEVGGQVGIVEHVGIRFTVLVSFSGAQVFIPNRTIANVINYPKGYVRAYLDVRLPDQPETAAAAKIHIQTITQAAYEQFPGIILVRPSVSKGRKTGAGYEYLRVKFRIWPGQGTLIETFIKQQVVQALRQLEPTYAEWMVAAYYRAEPEDATPDRQLPRPAALRKRSSHHEWANP